MDNITLKFMMRRVFLFPLLLSLLCGAVLAKSERQELTARTVTMKGNKVPLADAFGMIRKQTGLTVFYGNQLLDDRERVSFDFNERRLTEVLDFLLEGKGIRYELRRDRVIVLEKAATGPAATSVSRTVQQQIRGAVRDTNGPVADVTVSVRGTNTVTSTDANGHYTIMASPGDILVFRRLGYTPQEASVGDDPTINITLIESVEDIDEVVVIGYGTVRKKDLTGSVAQVKAQEVNAFPNANVLQALSGRAPGVQIRQGSGAPGPSITVRIRGGNSIQGSNEPLYVIDGFPIQGSNPSHVNNADIESVEILKDASATAIYGSRGANGVVIITTKKGKQGKTNVNLETSYGTQRLIRKIEMMNGRQYAEFYNEQAVNDNLQPYFTQEEIDGFGEGFDWQDFIFRTAPIATASLNMSGGNANTQFAVTGSFFGQEGIIKGSDYDRYSLQSSLNHKINDKFRVEVSSVLSRLDTRRRDSGGGNRGNSMIAGAMSAPPTLTPYNDDGSYRILHEAYSFLATDLRNPINFINEQFAQTKANVVLLNANVSYTITPDLILKIAGGIENRDDRSDNYTTTRFFGSPGIANIATGQQTSLLNENTLNYNKTIAEKHTFNAVAGFTFQNFLITSVEAGGQGFLSDVPETHELIGANTPGVPKSEHIKSALVSFLGRVNYSYDDRYLATVSFRRDGSSRYSAGNKWGNFPSAAFAWRISNEPFMTGQQVFSDLKLRASWGLTGSQAIDPYYTLNMLEAGKTIFDNDYFTTYAPGTRLPAPLKWETTEQLDVGLDIGMLKNKLLLTVDWYNKNTRDLLSVVALPSSMGYTTTVQNVGKIQNRGLELGIDAQLFDTDFRWNVNANIAFNKSKVLSLYNGEDLLRDNISMIIVSDATSILREGQPVGRFWGYLEEGYDDKGDIIYSDLTGDGNVTAADKTYIGDPNPDFIYGFNSTMNFKNFEFSFFLQGTYGNDIFNASAITNTMDYGFGLNMPVDVYENHWTPTNPNPKYPRISRSTPVRVSERFIEDGSYLRLKNISLAYNLPVSALQWSWAQNLQVYVSGQNLLTFTNYSWWDPEVNFRLDHNRYPSAKSFTFGLRAGF